MPESQNLFCTLSWQHDTLTLSFLVDSGADGCFIDQEVVRQSDVSTVELSEPVTFLALNGLEYFLPL